MQKGPLLQDFVSAEAALRELCACVEEADASLLGGEEVAPSEMPAVYRELLVHSQHMTPRLSSYHGGSLALRVLRERHEGSVYNREITLTVPESGGVVELGIVRMNLECTRPEVRDAILAKVTPLGDILNQHHVLTRVEPQWYLRFGGSGKLSEWFDGVDGGAMYGRIGTIYFHEQPAVELLEIVTDRRSP